MGLTRNSLLENEIKSIIKVKLKDPIVWKVECFQMVGFSDSMSIIRYDSIRDYHVMNVRNLVFVTAAAGGIYRR